MKRHCILATLVFGLLGAGAAGAAGLGASVGVGVIAISKADNLWGHGKSTIPDLSTHPSESSYALLAPAIELSYRGGSGSELYFGTVDEPGSVTAGVKKSLAGQSIDARVFYSFIGSAWEDPYVLARTRTDLDEYGVKVTYARKGLSLSYKAALSDVGNDVSGATYPVLARDGHTHTLKAAYGFPVAKGWVLTPGLVYTAGIFDGAASSYKGPGASLALGHLAEGGLYLRAAVETRKSLFDEVHPVFGVTRDERATEGSVMASVVEPFGYKGLVVSTFLFNGTGSSNIEFFQRRSSMAYVGAAYRF